MTFRNRTIFISGASRGSGLAIACRLARDGANIILAAKTAEPHPKLPGTVYSAAKEIVALRPSATADDVLIYAAGLGSKATA